MLNVECFPLRILAAGILPLVLVALVALRFHGTPRQKWNLLRGLLIYTAGIAFLGGLCPPFLWPWLHLFLWPVVVSLDAIITAALIMRSSIRANS